MKLFRLTLAAAALACACSAQAQMKAPKTSGATPAPAAAAPAAAPSGDAAKEEAGRLVAAGWLTLLDRQDWGGAWDRSAALFRQSVPLATWMDGIPKTREPLGALVERQPAETAYKTTLPGRPDGEYVTTLFVSKFANKADAVETVTTVRESDGKWRVTGYSTR
ncbi:DUF4019 domain-containing protein [Ramlibacter sp.]|uniref:DUF4019 domain-containing protein n=1 Tax=Ramlibacter sp. TaxID=1917967 RepID=UPI00185A9CE8|nr:DUF4019 domain-containing protein [Ramlibacter sp.]MBA2672173.1 DUF4019 domain-containing protein [Ramlibacter sp.]